MFATINEEMEYITLLRKADGVGICVQFEDQIQFNVNPTSKALMFIRFRF